MKYYQLNRHISYAIFALASLSLAFWVSLLALHAANLQWINIQQNPSFTSALATCGFTYPLSTSFSVAANQFSVSASPPNIVYIGYAVGYHRSYQRISIVFLFLNGGAQTVVILIGVFLLLKSRQPYKDSWHLGNVKGLKISIYTSSFVALIGALVYEGYTLNFYLTMQNTSCTPLLSYALSYQTNAILGGIMTLTSGLVYFLTIGIRLPSRFLDDKVRVEQDTKETLVTLEANAQAQRIISERLANLPKINQYKPGEIIEMRQPSEFMMSETEEYRIAPVQQKSQQKSSHPPNPKPNPNQLNNQVASKFNNLLSANMPYNIASPPRQPSVKKQPSFYVNPFAGRVPRLLQPVVIEEVQVNIEDKLNQLKNRQKQKMANQTKIEMTNPQPGGQRILDELYRQPTEIKSAIKNYPSPGKKPRLKLFKSKNTSPVSQLKRQWGYT